MENNGLDFALTVEEKEFIRAYVAYKKAVNAPTRVSDVLEVFAWHDEKNERYVPANRDFLLDDQRYIGAFAVMRKALGDEISLVAGSK